MWCGDERYNGGGRGGVVEGENGWQIDGGCGAGIWCGYEGQISGVGVWVRYLVWAGQIAGECGVAR